MYLLFYFILVIISASMSLVQPQSNSTSKITIGPSESTFLSKQQIKKVEKHLAHLLALPSRKFSRIDREKRMTRSENKFLLEMYEMKHEQRQKKYNFQQHSRTVRRSNYVVTYGVKNNKVNNTQSELMLIFNLAGIPNLRNLIKAELRLFRQPKTDNQTQRYQILTHTINKNGTFVQTEDEWTEQSNGWMVIDVSKLILSRLEDYVTIYVSAKVDHWDAAMSEDVGIAGVDSDLSSRPFLVAYFDADLNLKMYNKLKPELNCRDSRNSDINIDEAEIVNPESLTSACSLKFFYVDFKQLDRFTSVIVPERYQANYCIGRCNFPLPGKTTNHAIIQALYSSVKSHLEPQCAPHLLEPLDIIHLDSEENLVHKTYEEMIVKTCTCQ